MAHKYNLIIVYLPKSQNIADFIIIRNMMLSRAPDIEVHILAHEAQVPASFWQQAANRPSLIFCPVAIPIEPTARGTRLVGKRRTKAGEIKLLTEAGFPVPRTIMMRPDITLDERDWGPFIVLKPNRGRGGKGIRLVRTRDAKWIDPNSWPADDPRHGYDMLAQQYVYSGPYPRSYRVFTVLGKAIFAHTSTATQPISLPHPDGADPVDLDVTSNGVERKLQLNNEADAIALAQNIHAKLPDIPTMGLDLLREDKTGKLFVIEMNSTGFTWQLSSNVGLGHQYQYGLDYYGQFNALDTIAAALIDHTRRLAS